MNLINRIRVFNELAGNTTDRFNIRQTALYIGLIAEEFGELLNTVGLGDYSEDMTEISKAFKSGEFDEYLKEKADRLQLMDDCVDIVVVATGCLLSQGCDVDGAFMEVSNANLSKIFPDGTLHKDENGKIIKPDGWRPPDLTPYLNTAQLREFFKANKGESE